MKKLFLSLLILNSYTLHMLSAEHIHPNDAAEEAEFFAVLTRYEQEEKRKLYENNILNNNPDILDTIDDDIESVEENIKSPPIPSPFNNDDYVSDDNWLDENWKDEEKDDSEEENETNLNHDDTIKQKIHPQKTKGAENNKIDKNSSTTKRPRKMHKQIIMIDQNCARQCPAQLDDGTQCSAHMIPAELTKHCINKHLKKEKRENRTHYTCLICNQITNVDLKSIRCHIANNHTHDKPFSCGYQDDTTTCLYITNQKFLLNVHRKNYNHYNCTTTPVTTHNSFNRRTIIDQNCAHQCPAQLDDNTQCPTHMIPAELTKHCMKEHLKTKKINKISHYTCLICHQMTSIDIRNIKDHITSNHTQYKPFACEYQNDNTVCSFIANRKFSLNAHRRNHNHYTATTLPNLLPIPLTSTYTTHCSFKEDQESTKQKNDSVNATDDDNDDSSYKQKRSKIDDN